MRYARVFVVYLWVLEGLELDFLSPVDYLRFIAFRCRLTIFVSWQIERTRISLGAYSV